MEESIGADRVDPEAADQPTVPVDIDERLPTAVAARWDREDALAVSEQFQTLAHEVRVSILVMLLAAEITDKTPVSFSRL